MLCATQVKTHTVDGICHQHFQENMSVSYVLMFIAALNFHRYTDNMKVHYATNAISP